MHTGLMDWIGIAVVLVIGIGVVSYGYFWDRTTNRQRAEELRQPPSALTSGLDPSLPTPNYVLATDLPKPTAMNPEAIQLVQERLAKATHLRQGYCSTDFASDEGSQLAVLIHPLVLVVDGNVTSMREIFPALERAHGAQRSLAVIAEAIPPEVVQTLAANSRAGKLATVALVAPSRDREQVAALTGASPVPVSDLRMDWLPPESLGDCSLWASDAQQSWIELS